MSERNLVRNEMQAEVLKKEVFLYNDTGGEVTYKKGSGVCHYVDFTGGIAKLGVSVPSGFTDHSDAAADASPLRTKIVRQPASGEACLKSFAGALLEAVTLADGDGQWVHIAEPGSVCYVLTNNDTAPGDILGCEGVDSGTEGEWPSSTKRGRGTAIAIQDVNGSGTDALILVRLDEGADTGLEDNS